jgi:hypothetical protein
MIREAKKQYTNDWKTAFKNLGRRLSGPAGLEIFKIWNWSHTSCSLMTMPDSSQGASGGTSENIFKHLHNY